MHDRLNYNEEITSYLESVKDKPKNTVSRIRIALEKIKDMPPDEVIKVIKELENKKLSIRRVSKSTYKKFFEYVDDEDMIRVIKSLSDEEVESVGCNYFFNVLELKQYIADMDTSEPRRLRTYVYAYLLFIGVKNSDIRNVDIYEFNESTDIITHGGREYSIKAMDINNTIHDELLNNKMAKGIDYDSGEYVTTTGLSPRVKSFQGTAFMRTALSPNGGVAANTALGIEDRQRIVRSGAFIRFYNLKKSTGLDTNTLFKSLDDDLMRTLNRHAIISEYEEFEKAYKEAGY